MSGSEEKELTAKVPACACIHMDISLRRRMDIHSNSTAIKFEYKLHKMWIKYVNLDRVSVFLSAINILEVKSLTLQHGPVSGVGDGENVRRNFVPLFALVDFDDLLGVDRQAFVGIDDHAEQAGVRLNE